MQTTYLVKKDTAFYSCVSEYDVVSLSFIAGVADVRMLSEIYTFLSIITYVFEV